MRKFEEYELFGPQGPFAAPQKQSYTDDSYDEEEDLLELEKAWEIGFERGERQASEESLGGESDDY